MLVCQICQIKITLAKNITSTYHRVKAVSDLYPAAGSFSHVSKIFRCIIYLRYAFIRTNNDNDDDDCIALQLYMYFISEFHK